jgi:hypothetical protein
MSTQKSDLFIVAMRLVKASGAKEGMDWKRRDHDN